MRQISILIFLTTLLAMPFSVHASSFTVSDIKVNGLERVSPGNVYSAFPISIGERVSTIALQQAIKRLFATGYFKDIEVSRDGTVLVIDVVELPTIASLTIDGNKSIPTEELMKGLKQSGLAEGLVLKRAVLERIKVELERQYSIQGRYDAAIATELRSLPRNRVAVKIDVNEGTVASIKHINIVGNKVFPDQELLDLFALRTSNFWSFYRSDDKYSKEKLSGDLEKLKSYYLDRGYVNFNIESTQVSIGPNKKDIYITVNVFEGDEHNIGGVKLAGDLIVDQTELEPLLIVKEGDTFSRQKLNTVSELITKRLGNEGYTFANVNVVPEIDSNERLVDVTFFVVPGKRTYVRQINFRGNTSTADHVLRREMVQIEGGWASTDLVQRSKQKLERLGFFKTVVVETKPVAGTDDQVDVEYTVEEQLSGSFQLNFGYAESSGFIIGSSISQNNFLGTGQKLSTSVNRSDIQTSLSFSFDDPYFTVDGVSRNYSIFYRETDFDNRNNVRNSFQTNVFGGAIGFGYPIGNTQRLNFSVGYKRTELEIDRDRAPLEIVNFRDLLDEGDNPGLDEFNLQATWSQNTLNRGIFATRGYRQSLSLQGSVPGSELEYYKIRYRGDRYLPLFRLNDDWALHFRTELGFGDGYGDSIDLPFYENFRAGGIGSVRGYRTSSLGPRGTEPALLERDEEGNLVLDEDGDPIVRRDESGNILRGDDPEAYGGNALVEFSAELIFPAPFIKDRRSVRTLLYFDAGNVFDLDCSFIDESKPNGELQTNPNCTEEVTLDNLRYSAGIGLSWITAIGPLSFTYSFPLNEGEFDETEGFEFNLGQTF